MAQLEKATPLEDVMVAMDVVDTLRHQQDIAERELDDEGRRARLLQRLRELYSAQGIEVADHVLNEGIDALEQERFQYQAVPRSWQTRLAHAWVSRGRWGKPAGFLAVLGALFGAVYLVTDVLPERQMRSQLPQQLASTMVDIRQTSQNPEIVNTAQQQFAAAKVALDEGRLDDAQKDLDEMKQVQRLLSTRYSIRVVSRAGKRSGVWRIPQVNEAARNYYLIVEAIDDDNNVLALDVVDEETNRSQRVETWGLRVNKQTFDRIASDKRDDGIIQNNIVGEKKIGYLQPKFSIPTTGGTITRW